MIEISIQENADADGYTLYPAQPMVGVGEGFSWSNETDDDLIIQIEDYQIKIAPGHSGVPLSLPAAADGLTYTQSYTVRGTLGTLEAQMIVGLTVVITEVSDELGKVTIEVNPSTLNVVTGQWFCWKNSCDVGLKITQSNQAAFSLAPEGTSNMTSLATPGTYSYNITDANGNSLDPEIVCDPDNSPAPHHEK